MAGTVRVEIEPYQLRRLEESVTHQLEVNMFDDTAMQLLSDIKDELVKLNKHLGAS